MERAPHSLTSNNSLPPYVTLASSFYGDFDAWRAFDGETPHPWLGEGGNGNDWLQIDLGSPVAIETYSIFETFQTVGGPAARSPQKWDAQGSPDGATWTTLDSQDLQTAWTDGETRTYTIAAPAAFRYFRLRILNNNGDSTYTAIGQLFLTGPDFYTPVRVTGARRQTLAASSPLRVTGFRRQIVVSTAPAGGITSFASFSTGGNSLLGGVQDDA